MLFIIIAIALVFMANREKLTVPNFDYPTYIPQPPGNQGWGYRDACATANTLAWEQSQPCLLMPKPSTFRAPDYVGLPQESYPVPVKENNTDCPRPPQPKIQQRPVASAPFASW